MEAASLSPPVNLLVYLAPGRHDSGRLSSLVLREHFSNVASADYLDELVLTSSILWVAIAAPLQVL